MNSILIKEDYKDEAYIGSDNKTDSFFYNFLNHSLSKSFNSILCDENESKYNLNTIESQIRVYSK